MSAKSKTLEEITEMVVTSFDSYVAQGTKKWDWQSAAKDLPYQVGSITKIMLQLTNERWADNKSESQLIAELSDELADVLAECLFIARGLKIDMNQSMDDMVESDKRKVDSRKSEIFNTNG